MGLKRSSCVARFAKDASGMLFSFAGIWSAMLVTIMKTFVLRGGTLIVAVQADGLAHAVIGR
jgi:putative SOS response-associated peptidase YedK